MGKTEDGKLVVTGLFELVDTHGIPLDIVVSKFEERGLMPSWTHFYDKAVKAGWKPEGVVQKLRGVVGDVYGPKFREGWEKRLKRHIEE